MKTCRADTVFYNIGKIIWIPVLFAGIWFAKSGFSQIGEMFACTFYKVCKLPCPGCGGTRAVFYLFSGQLWKSFCYHPVVICAVGAYLHFMLRYWYRKHISKAYAKKEISIEYYVYGMIGVIFLQWAVKLIYHFLV